MTEHRSDIRAAFARHAHRTLSQPLPIAWRRALLLTLIWFASIALYLWLRVPLGELPARSIGIFFFAAVCWATEVIPLYATSFLVVAGEILLLASDGGLADEITDFVQWIGLPAAVQSMAGDVEAVSASAFLAPFARDIMFLFMGGFLLSAAVTRHGLDRVIARLILAPFRCSPLGLLIALVAISAFLSMWMSNTATAAMLVAVVRPLIQNVPESERYRTGIVLAIPLGANIGGIGTPIGTAPNAIAFSALNAAGYDISFIDWMFLAVPLLLVLLSVGVLVLWMFHRPSRGFEMPTDAFGDLSARPKISGMGRITLVVVCLAILGWLTGDLTGISPGVVALIAAAILTATRTLDKHDVDSIDWNVLILMWGGLSLSVALSVSGLADMIAGVDPSQLPGGPFLIGVAVAAFALVLSTFMSNTATAGLIVPMALALSVQDRAELAIIAALCCSFAMAMPVSTPPNAIAYATGAIRLWSLLRLGAIVGIVSVGITLAGYRFVLPLVIDGEVETAASSQEPEAVGASGDGSAGP